MKQVLIAVLVVVGIIGAAVAFSGDDSVDGAGSNLYYGQENGIVTVTEFADFQCAGCASFYPIVTQIKEQFKDQIRFELKHFPLVSIHPNAVAAHRAAQAAANQGKFWEMHNRLYEQQAAWENVTNPADIFRGYAEQLELNMEQYDQEVNSAEVLSIINADVSQGKDLGVSGTPSFFIDGVEIENPTVTVNTVESFSARIQEAIDAKTGGEDSTQPVENETRPDPTNSEETTRPEEETEATDQ